AFFQRMAREFKAFWTDERKAKARKAGLSQSQVATLASIVQAEQSNHRDERPRVAGLYVNRLHKGMRLQADPTVIYALQDFSIRRVLNVHKDVDSPYNTYRHAGLPPGPINLPEIASLDAVLNHEQHNYLYMCAKPDFSGYHNFAKTYEQHLVNARKFQRELNKRKIYR
ncbi:MAG: endolytic transglycosylase MltG, partial [Bacteroidota bacterium]